jgi:PKD repeat protein
MKIIKLFTLIFLLTVSCSYAQVSTVEMTLFGYVIDTTNGTTVSSHLVTMEAIPDSINIFTPITDTTYTDAYGYYSITLTTPWIPGTAIMFFVSTLDCNDEPVFVYHYYNGDSTSYLTNIHICGDSIPPPTCENQIQVTSINGLTVNLQGSINPPQTATYNWQFGDGTAGYGEITSHTYANEGTYAIILQTTTQNGCVDNSTYYITLEDSTAGNCINWITYYGIPGTLEVNFQGNSNPAAVSHSWDFGDPASGINNTSSLQNTSHIYTFPGYYTVMLGTTDGSGCTFLSTLAVNVDSVGVIDTLAITGTLNASGVTLQAGAAKLYAQDSTGSYFLNIYSYFVSGSFSFSQLADGNYIILGTVEEDSILSQIYVPTYYGDVIFWDDATVISLGYPQNPYTIHLVPIDSIIGGTGSIMGQLILGGDGAAFSIAYRRVILLDEMGAVVAYTYTDENGFFSFASLSMGEYQVHPDLMSVTTYPVNVLLTSAIPIANVTMTLTGNILIGFSEARTNPSSMVVYPNPARDEIFVRINSQMEQEFRVEIMDITGQLLRQYPEHRIYEAAATKYSISGLPAGVYILKLSDTEGNTSLTRFIKQQ